jgi:hypothetical protein
LSRRSCLRASLRSENIVSVRTRLDPSSTPMIMMPPAAFANATTHLRMLSGDDKSRLNSRVFSLRSFQQLKEPHNSAFYSEARRPQGFRPRWRLPASMRRDGVVDRPEMSSRIHRIACPKHCLSPVGARPRASKRPTQLPTNVLLVPKMKFIAKLLPRVVWFGTRRSLAYLDRREL